MASDGLVDQAALHGRPVGYYVPRTEGDATIPEVLFCQTSDRS